eukprot:12995102-Alexandrium_andersonii.AAC.1
MRPRQARSRIAHVKKQCRRAPVSTCITACASACVCTRVCACANRCGVANFRPMRDTYQQE